jgi:hypothetical protein
MGKWWYETPKSKSSAPCLLGDTSGSSVLIIMQLGGCVQPSTGPYMPRIPNATIGPSPYGEKIRVDRPRLQQQHKQYKHDQSCSLMNKSGLRQIGLADNNRTSSDHKSRPVYQKPASLGQYNTSDELEATTAIWPHEINSRRHALSLPQGLPLVYNDIDPARIEDVWNRWRPADTKDKTEVRCLGVENLLTRHAVRVSWAWLFFDF